MSQKLSVGLVVLTDVPSLGKVAILQRRGEWNHEKMGPESFPGICQVTCHGSLSENETFEQALLREAEEELGSEAMGLIAAAEERNELVMILQRDLGDKIVRSYALPMPADFLKILRLGPSSGGIRLLRTEELDAIQTVDPKDAEQKAKGVADRRVTAMFGDEMQAVAIALTKLFTAPLA